MNKETIKNMFLLFIVIILVISTFISLLDYNVYEIPSIVSFIGWIIAILLNVFKNIRSKLYIRLKGFFVDTVTLISMRITNVDNFDSFIHRFRDELENNERIEIISFPIVNSSIYLIKVKLDEWTINFSINNQEDMLEESSIYLKFDPIQNRHKSVNEYAGKIDYLLRIIGKNINHSKSNSFVTVNVSYPNKNNPLINHLIYDKSVSLIAEGKCYTITNDYIEINSIPSDMKDNVKNTLTGNLQN